MILKNKTHLQDRTIVRSFVSIPISIDVARKLTAGLQILKTEARNFNFTPNDQMHVTLQFLGDTISENSLNAIRENLAGKINKIFPPVIRISQLKFGHKSQTIPRVLFYEIEQTQELMDLTREIHFGIKELRLADVKREKDYSKLIFHITVGRVKHSVSRSFGRKINELISKVNYPEIEYYPEKLQILSSRFSPKGHSYFENSSFTFKKQR